MDDEQGDDREEEAQSVLFDGWILNDRQRAFLALCCTEQEEPEPPASQE